MVISASHNPFEHNGIKIFNGRGFKLSDELENRIEDIILNDVAVPLKTGGDIGRVIYADQKESQDYIDHLVSTIGSDLAGLHILVDCANGAASATAARLFDRFPDLHTDVIHADPDGVNINNGHLEQLKAMVKAGGYDLGIAFDGDADRCLMVDETGEEIDGDQVIAACGLDLKEKGELSGGAIVATVMSNLGLHRFCQEHGVALFCTSVGDRNVLEKMEESGYVIGGEQSGHTIFRRYSAAPGKRPLSWWLGADGIPRCWSTFPWPTRPRRRPSWPTQTFRPPLASRRRPWRATAGFWCAPRAPRP